MHRGIHEKTEPLDCIILHVERHIVVLPIRSVPNEENLQEIPSIKIKSLRYIYFCSLNKNSLNWLGMGMTEWMNKYMNEFVICGRKEEKKDRRKEGREGGRKRERKRENKCWQWCEKIEHFCTADKNVKWCWHCGKQGGYSSQN